MQVARVHSNPETCSGQALQLYTAGSLSADHPDEPLDCSLPQYAFCRGEKQLLRICMHSATSAGAALALQGAATGLLGERCC